MTKVKENETVSSWKELRDIVKALPITETVYMRDGQLELERRGNQIFGICPYHSDTRVGNFAIGGPHNGFKCFACGKAGDMINLIITLDEVSFKEALMTIAKEFDILTEEDAKNFQSEGRPVNVTIRNMQKENTSNPYAELDDKQIKHRHAVYSLLSEGDAIDGKGSRLSEEHYRQLKDERGLSEEQIEEAGFFTMKEGYGHLSVLYSRLFEEYGYFPNVLNVPGFWRVNNGLTIGSMRRPDGSVINFDDLDIEDQYYWFSDTIDALGIPIRNENGHIVAIQLRPDDQNYGGKYIWFSSTFATGVDNKIDGLSTGAQQDVKVPEGWDSKHVFITEGIFKSLAITDAFNGASISLQGVNTFRGVGRKFEHLNESIEKVIVAFDADLAFNGAVMKAVIDMADKELSNYEVTVAIWDHYFGKGIDDYMQEAPIDAMTEITLDEIKHLMNVLDTQVSSKYVGHNTAEDREREKQEREDVFFYWLSIAHPELRLHSNRKVLQG